MKKIKDKPLSPFKIIYILLHFPYPTETFVAQEIHALRQQGIEIDIVSLLRSEPGPMQPLSQKLLSDTWYAPGLLNPRLWFAQWHFLFKTPSLYKSLLARLLRQPYPHQPVASFAKRVVIFLKAVSAAHALESTHAQLIHAHFAWLAGAAAWVCARLLNLPFTVTAHAYDLYASSDLIPLVSREADHMVTVSQYNRRHLIDKLECPDNAVSVIHCGVNLAEFWPRSPSKHSTNGQLRILSVGQLTAKKGYRYLLAACALLKGRGMAFSCTIIGSGPEEINLRRLIAGYGLDHEVHLLGARPHPEVRTAYQAHDMFVLAPVVAPGGDRDGIPVVLMEAGAMGLPLIASQLSGIPELVRHDQTGYLVSPGDAHALAEAIATLAADPVLKRRLGRHARRLVEAEFNIDDSAARLITLFRNLCRQK